MNEETVNLIFAIWGAAILTVITGVLVAVIWWMIRGDE